VVSKSAATRPSVVDASVRTKRICIFEPNHSGHRLFYVRRLAEFGGVSSATLFTTAESRASVEFSAHIGELASAGRITVKVVGSASDSRWRLLSRAVSGASTTLVVPEADALLPLLLMRAAGNFRRRLPALRGLITRTHFSRWPTGRSDCTGALKALLIRLLPLMWPGTRLFFLTDAFGVVRRRTGYSNLTAVPDPPTQIPTADRDIARRQLGIPPGTFLLGIIGVISSYKYPSLLFDALRQLPDSVRLLMAGPVSPSERAPADAAVRAFAGRIIRLDRYLDGDELALCFHACDGVVLARDTDLPSGALISAVAAGVPLLAAGSPWICRVVDELGIGVVADMSADGLAAAVRRLMADPGAFERGIDAARRRLDPDTFAAELLR
jgi:glycosyltransferase involved in cell wall biosynthesis